MLRWVIEAQLEDRFDTARETACARDGANFDAVIDEIVHRHAPATELVEGDEVTVRAHGRFCREIDGRYVVELSNGVRVEVRPDMLVRRRKGEG